MKRIWLLGVLLLMLILLAGCATTKWECSYGNCIDYDRAVNKCLAQANSAFNSNRSNIWSQCMRGEGYQQYRCNDGEARYNRKCQVLHVY